MPELKKNIEELDQELSMDDLSAVAGGSRGSAKGTDIKGGKNDEPGAGGKNDGSGGGKGKGG